MYLDPIKGGGTNSAALGYSNTTYGTDFSGLYGNPASLGLLKRSEFSVGIDLQTVKNNSSFLNTNNDQSYSSTNLSNLSYVFPIGVSQGSFVLGFGFNTYVDFNELSKGTGYNPNSSYPQAISSYNPNARFNSLSEIEQDFNLKTDSNLDNIGYDLYFDYAFRAGLITVSKDISDTSLYRYRTTVFGNTQQEYKNVSEGNMRSYNISGSIEAAKDVFVGVSVNFISGYYKNNYTWKETGNKNYYRSLADSALIINGQKSYFSALQMNETLDDEITGYNIKVGTLVKLNEKVKVGFSITLPTRLLITSKYSYDLVANFVDFSNNSTISHAHLNGKYSEEVNYELNGPTVFEVNIGYVNFPFQTEIGVITENWSNTSFESADGSIDFSKTNEELKFDYKRTYNFKAGFQYAFSELNSFLKAGFNLFENPTQNSEQSNYNFLYSIGIEYVPSIDYSFNVGYLLMQKNISYTAFKPVPETGKAAVTYTEEHFKGNLFVSVSFKF